MYKDKRNWKYFVGFGLLVVLLLITIFLIVRGGGGDENNREANNGQPAVSDQMRKLTDYYNDDSVTISQTIVGPIVAAENHYELKVNVSNTSATIETIQGYDGNVIRNKSYPTSTASFSEFLNSLERAGFTNGNTDPTLRSDEGYCPTGNRYIFEVRDGATVLQRFWATSCRTTKTYRGDLSLTNSLFRSQIPEYGEMTNGTGLGSSNNVFDIGINPGI